MREILRSAILICSSCVFNKRGGKRGIADPVSTQTQKKIKSATIPALGIEAPWDSPGQLPHPTVRQKMAKRRAHAKDLRLRAGLRRRQLLI